MNSKNSVFENSLACMQHPLVLFSIVILLVNDHVLKVVSPSWLTGKLSDFAGLFFFPFVVAAGLSLVLSKFNWQSQGIGQIAFSIVVTWFALLKTVPAVNSLTAQLASVFIAGSARLALDPTDLTALIVLWPAWGIWQNHGHKIALKKAYFSLAVGVLACLATSPPAPKFDEIVALAYQNNVLYAKDSNSGQYLQSTDNGMHWYRPGSLESLNRLENLFVERQVQTQLCDPTMPTSCYRIEGTDQIYYSAGPGHSWEISWEIPDDQREFIMGAIGKVEMRDLLIVEYGSSRYLFVAAGRYGLLRKQLPHGEWLKIKVEEAGVIPFYAPSILPLVNDWCISCQRIALATMCAGDHSAISIGVVYFDRLFSINDHIGIPIDSKYN